MNVSQTKTCSKCRVEQPLSGFYKHKNKKDGFSSSCKQCGKKYHEENKEKRNRQCREYYEKNKEKLNASHRTYHENYYQINREKILEKNRQWSQKNREKHKELICLWGQSNKERLRELSHQHYLNNLQKHKERNRNWWRRNPEKRNAKCAKRRAQKLKATPSWLTSEHLEQIALFYTASKDQLKFGIKCHVDHIVPLQGENVCGLHVLWNLQVLTASENLKKKNNF